MHLFIALMELMYVQYKTDLCAHTITFDTVLIFKIKIFSVYGCFARMRVCCQLRAPHLSELELQTVLSHLF